jgi:hypothetical protein
MTWEEILSMLELRLACVSLDCKYYSYSIWRRIFYSSCSILLCFASFSSWNRFLSSSYYFFSSSNSRSLCYALLRVIEYSLCFRSSISSSLPNYDCSYYSGYLYIEPVLRSENFSVDYYLEIGFLILSVNSYETLSRI